MRRFLAFVVLQLTCLTVFAVSFSFSQEEPVTATSGPYGSPPNLGVVSKQEWNKIDKSVDRAIEWLAKQQDEDGSWPTHVGGRPAVSALVILAFLSDGHQAGDGPKGEAINRGVDFVLGCQRKDGMFLVDSTDMPVTQWERGSHTGLYNHAIASLMLCEVYGSADAARQERISEAITRALMFARKLQRRKQLFEDDKGGFRYYKSLNGFAGKGDSDLSVTGWYVLFFRAAKNAGFDVPKEYVEQSVAYARRCYDPQTKTFRYGLHGHDKNTTGRGMTGAGLMCLTALGDQDEKIARAAGNWILEHPFDEYGGRVGWYDRYHYGGYYCSQAMLQLGGDYWAKFYPTFAKTLIENQTANGAWPPEQAHGDAKFGSTYSTAITVLSLTAPNQLLPVHQR